MIYVSENRGPQWVGGGVTKTDNDITVNSTMGSHTYKLFDHITVSGTLFK